MDDGTVGDVDFVGREWRGVFEPLRDPDYFVRVIVDAKAGTVTCPNGADLAPEPLYAEARRRPRRVDDSRPSSIPTASSASWHIKSMTSRQLYVASSGVDEQPALAMAETAQPSADQQRFRFVLPRLYTFAPDVVGRVFHSHLGAHPIEIRVPDSPRHKIQPRGKTGLGSEAEWVVPRWLELAGPAALNLEGPEIHTQLKAWWRRATDWLAAWLGAPAGADIPLERLALSLDDHASDDSSPRGVMQFYGFDGETHATSEELARALEFTGTSAELPTAYILLVRGESAYAQRDMRLAVIEACGAAEVAAAVAIEQALAERYGCPADFVRAVARGARSIRRAHETIVQLGVACGAEKSAIEELAKLRNSAVHAGRPVEDLSASRALVIVRSMVTTILGQAAPSPEATT